eukprot:scpid107655/ scgid28708/ 
MSIKLYCQNGCRTLHIHIYTVLLNHGENPRLQSTLGGRYANQFMVLIHIYGPVPSYTNSTQQHMSLPAFMSPDLVLQHTHTHACLPVFSSCIFHGQAKKKEQE